MTDDDLRFGDVSGSDTESKTAVDRFVDIFKLLILLYVILTVVEVLFNIPVPLV